MIVISEIAKKELGKILAEKGGADSIGLRLSVHGGVPGAYQSSFRLVKKGDNTTSDMLLDQGDFNIYVDPDSASKLDRVKIDVVPTFRGPSFKIEFPLPEWDDPLANEVQKLISERINPGVAVHGGYVTLLDVKDKTVYLSMGGGCQGCGLSSVTLRQGIETMILEEIPEIQEIVDQTDHESGLNPYYTSASGTDVQGDSPLAN